MTKRIRGSRATVQTTKGDEVVKAPIAMTETATIPVVSLFLATSTYPKRVFYSVMIGTPDWGGPAYLLQDLIRMARELF